MITTTGRAIIEDSLRLLGVIGIGIPMSQYQSELGLTTLNGLLDAWGTNRNTIYAIGRTVTTAANGAASYSIGLTSPASDFPQARPLWIAWASFIDPSSSDPDVEIPLPVITDQAYQAQQVKDQTNSLPSTLYYQPTSGDAGTIILWPVLTQDIDIVLYVPTALELMTLTTSVVLPPGYMRALRYNLACEMSAYYGQVNPNVIGMLSSIAASSLADLKRANERLSDLAVDPGLLSANRPLWNIYTGP